MPYLDVLVLFVHYIFLYCYCCDIWRFFDNRMINYAAICTLGMYSMFVVYKQNDNTLYHLITLSLHIVYSQLFRHIVVNVIVWRHSLNIQNKTSIIQPFNAPPELMSSSYLIVFVSIVLSFGPIWSGTLNKHSFTLCKLNGKLFV